MTTVAPRTKKPSEKKNLYSQGQIQSVNVVFSHFFVFFTCQRQVRRHLGSGTQAITPSPFNCVFFYL